MIGEYGQDIKCVADSQQGMLVTEFTKIKVSICLKHCACPLQRTLQIFSQFIRWKPPAGPPFRRSRSRNQPVAGNKMQDWFHHECRGNGKWKLQPRHKELWDEGEAHVQLIQAHAQERSPSFSFETDQLFYVAALNALH